MNKKNIIIVDDDALIAEAIRRALLPRSLRQKVFDNPQDALREILADPAAWDIVITDYGMPGMSGIELARRLRQAGFNGKIILISGDMAAAFPQLTDGLVDTTLEKPLSLKALLCALA